MVTAVRVTVVGPDGRSDLLVPTGARVDTVASAYAEQLGAGVAPPLFTSTGHRLDPTAAVLDAITDGDLVVAVPESVSRAGAPDAARPRPAAAVPTGRAPAARFGLGVAAAMAAAGVLTAATYAGADGLVWARPAVVVLLLVVAGGMVAIDSGERALLLGPAVGAAAAVAAAWSGGPGGAVVAVAAGGLGALVFAALGRIWLPADVEDLSRTWLIGGGLVAAVAVTALLLGAGPVTVCAVVFAIAVSAVRLLPATVVDLPDDVLLDLDRLAVTAWSARERPRGGRRRHQVRVAMVRDAARRSARAVSAAVALAAALSAVAAPVVVVGDPQATTWAHWGGVAMVAAGAAFLSLVGRGFRSPVVRVVLGLTALWASGLAGVALVLALGPNGRWAAFGIVALLTGPVLVAAVRLGRGWRSVWWARTGEVLETLTGVLVLALAPLATGLFDVVRVATGR